jgi:hypothetical protein
MSGRPAVSTIRGTSPLLVRSSVMSVLVRTGLWFYTLHDRLPPFAGRCPESRSAQVLRTVDLVQGNPTPTAWRPELAGQLFPLSSLVHELQRLTFVHGNIDFKYYLNSCYFHLTYSLHPFRVAVTLLCDRSLVVFPCLTGRPAHPHSLTVLLQR